MEKSALKIGLIVGIIVLLSLYTTTAMVIMYDHNTAVDKLERQIKLYEKRHKQYQDQVVYLKSAYEELLQQEMVVQEAPIQENNTTTDAINAQKQALEAQRLALLQEQQALAQKSLDRQKALAQATTTTTTTKNVPKQTTTTVKRATPVTRSS